MFMWYEHKARDFKLMAANLARSYDKYITMENIKLYERMIRESSWWDVCDNMTPNIIGRLLEKFPD
jgi:3-methyladenine DNA glycosylase AlkD